MKKLYFLVIPILICSLIFNASFRYKKSAETASEIKNSNKPPIIIIDAGHGGFDGGAQTDDGFPEKNINLSIALHLRSFLKALGFETIMTREADVSLESEGIETIRKKKTSDIHNRLNIMKETDNSIFISIHQNHYHEAKYYGTQVFYSPREGERSSLLAQSIQTSVTDLLQPENDRQIKKCGTSVYLIYNAVKPAVLVECGFLSNLNEAELLKTEEYQRKIAFCIALGIQEYVYGA